jgi:hypothetical protein
VSSSGEIHLSAITTASNDKPHPTRSPSKSTWAPPAPAARPPERSWLVRIRRADRYVTIAIGLRRHAADRLAEQLTDLLTDTKEVQPNT